MIEEIWHGHTGLFNLPIKAHWLPNEKNEDTMLIVGIYTLGLPKDQAISLAKWILASAEILDAEED